MRICLLSWTVVFMGHTSSSTGMVLLLDGLYKTCRQPLGWKALTQRVLKTVDMTLCTGTELPPGSISHRSLTTSKFMMYIPQTKPLMETPRDEAWFSSPSNHFCGKNSPLRLPFWFLEAQSGIKMITVDNFAFSVYLCCNNICSPQSYG